MDESLAQFTREWLTKALHDLQTARITANAADGPLDTAIYHCQQTAEKSVKAWLTAKDVPFERTHDLRRLIRQASCLNSHNSSARLKFSRPAFPLSAIQD